MSSANTSPARHDRAHQRRRSIAFGFLTSGILCGLRGGLIGSKTPTRSADAKGDCPCPHCGTRKLVSPRDLELNCCASCRSGCKPRLPDTITADADTLIQAVGGDVTITPPAEGSPEGAVPTFHMLAYTGGKMNPQGWPIPVVAALEGVEKVPNPVALCWHDKTQPAGHFTDIAITTGAAGKIEANGVMSGASKGAEEVTVSSRKGFPWKSSVGLRPTPGHLQKIEAGQSVRVNGRSFEGPLFVAWRSKLYEISFVPVAGDEFATARVAASGTQGPAQELFTMEPFEQWVEAQGFTLASLTDAQRTSMQATYDRLNASAGSHPPANPPAPPAAPPAAPPVLNAEADILAYRQQMTGEQTRVRRINEICGQHGNPTFRVNNQDVFLAEHAIEQGWDTNRTELEALREARGRAPAGHSRSSDSFRNADVLAATILTACNGREGFSLESPHLQGRDAQAFGLPTWLTAGANTDAFGRTMDAAHRLRRISMLDICRLALEADGRVLFDQQEIIEAAFGSGTLSAVFTTNVGAQVLDSFEQAGDTSLAWTSTNNTIPNFLMQERTRLLAGGGDLQLLPESATAQEARLDEKSEQYKIARFARKFTIDEMSIINDNMGIFTDLPRKWGDAAGRLRPDLVYAELLSNPTMADTKAMFHADHSNLLTSHALAAATVKTAYTNFRKQRENQVILNLVPDFTLVPPELEVAAAELNNSTEVRQASANGGVTENWCKGKLGDVISEARLTHGVVHPITKVAQTGSATSWYMGTKRFRAMEVGTLRGTNGRPQIRSYQLSQGQYGRGWDIMHAIGSKFVETLTLEKMTA